MTIILVLSPYVKSTLMVRLLFHLTNQKSNLLKNVLIRLPVIEQIRNRIFVDSVLRNCMWKETITNCTWSTNPLVAFINSRRNCAYKANIFLKYRVSSTFRSVWCNGIDSLRNLIKGTQKNVAFDFFLQHEAFITHLIECDIITYSHLYLHFWTHFY